MARTARKKSWLRKVERGMTNCADVILMMLCDETRWMKRREWERKKEKKGKEGWVVDGAGKTARPLTGPLRAVGVDQFCLEMCPSSSATGASRMQTRIPCGRATGRVWPGSLPGSHHAQCYRPLSAAVWAWAGRGWHLFVRDGHPRIGVGCRGRHGVHAGSSLRWPNPPLWSGVPRGWRAFWRRAGMALSPCTCAPTCKATQRTPHRKTPCQAAA